MNRAGQRGMTLLELMVALFVFAVAVGGFLKVLGESARHAEALEERYFAQQLAHNRLVEVHLQPAWPALGISNGEDEMGGRHYRWQQRVDGTADAQIRRVTVTVGSEPDTPLAELVAFVGETP